jgi:hypothetical protein
LIIVFTTIDALTFLNFDDDSLKNWNLFIELRDNVFFMFFEFMISTFVYEFLFYRVNSLCCRFLYFALTSKMIRNAFLIFNLRQFFFLRNDHFLLIKKDLRFDERCDDELENFANRLRFLCEVQSQFDTTRQINLLFFFYFHFAIRDLRDVFTIFTYVESFMLVYDVEIVIARTLFFRVSFIYDNSLAMFIDIVVFLTIKALL